MFRLIRRLDSFNKNIIIVFLGTSLINIFNLLYQLLLAHRMSSADFAAFNSLLSIFMLISTPLTTIQTAVAKYSAEFRAQNQAGKIKALLTGLTRKILFPAVVTFFIFFFAFKEIFAYYQAFIAFFKCFSLRSICT